MELKDKVCLITGASKGLGRDIAVRFAQEGCDLILNGRSETDLNEVKKEIDGLGRRALVARCDVSNKEEVDRMAELALLEFGKIDILVNNAGGAMNTNHVFSRVTEEEWDKIIDVNLKGVFLCCKAVIPAMIERGGGVIINMSSLAGRASGGRLAGIQYTAAKYGVNGMTKHLARDFGPEGIRVNAIAPGIVLSKRVKDLYESRSEEYKRKVMENTPLGRLGEPGEITDVAVYLASEKSSYIHGAIIDVNGGAYMA